MPHSATIALYQKSLKMRCLRFEVISPIFKLKYEDLKKNLHKISHMLQKQLKIEKKKIILKKTFFL